MITSFNSNLIFLTSMSFHVGIPHLLTGNTLRKNSSICPWDEELNPEPYSPLRKLRNIVAISAKNKENKISKTPEPVQGFQIAPVAVVRRKNPSCRRNMTETSQRLKESCTRESVFMSPVVIKGDFTKDYFIWDVNDSFRCSFSKASSSQRVTKSFRFSETILNKNKISSQKRIPPLLLPRNSLGGGEDQVFKVKLSKPPQASVLGLQNLDKCFLGQTKYSKRSWKDRTRGLSKMRQ